MNLKEILKGNKGIAKWLIPAIVGVVVVFTAIIIICVAVNAKKTINLNDYVVITEKGYDGYGEIDIEIDWSAIEEDYGDDIKFTPKAKKDTTGILQLVTPVSLLDWYITAEPESDNLSNGDVVKYSFKVNDEWEEYVKCKIKYTDATYTVENLKPLETFDIFEDAEVSFEGLNGEAKINFNIGYRYSRHFGSNDFIIDKTENLKNGDVVTITVDEEAIKLHADFYHEVPAESSKQFKVSGLKTPINNVEDLTPAEFNELENDAEKKVKSVATSYKITYMDMKYYGYVYEVKGDIKILKIIYEQNQKCRDTEYVAYIPVCFKNISRTDSDIVYDECYVSGKFRAPEAGWIDPDVSGYGDIWTCVDGIASDKDATYKAGGEFEKYIGYKYIEKLSDIRNESIEGVKEKAEETVRTYVKDSAENINYTIIEDVSYFGECLTYDQNSSSYYVIYTAKLKYNSSYSRERQVYFPVKFANWYKLTNGDIVEPNNHYIVGDFNFMGYSTIKGYDSIDGSLGFCRDILNSNSEVLGELKNYVK